MSNKITVLDNNSYDNSQLPALITSQMTELKKLNKKVSEAEEKAEIARNSAENAYYMSAGFG